MISAGNWKDAISAGGWMDGWTEAVYGYRWMWSVHSTRREGGMAGLLDAVNRVSAMYVKDGCSVWRGEGRNGGEEKGGWRRRVFLTCLYVNPGSPHSTHCRSRILDSHISALHPDGDKRQTKG